MIKEIRAGKLKLCFSNGENRLDELLGFASRANPKRGYLFVSNVLGKHVPVQPSVMRQTYSELATLCIDQGTVSPELSSSVYVVGMAETATGLGAGIADSYAKLLPNHRVIYQHTTRHIVDRPIWIQADESHSHAVDQLLYQPNIDVKTDIKQSSHLILVDDEVSTGRTLFKLAEKLLPELPHVKTIQIVTLVNWLKIEDRERFKHLPVPVQFIALIEGEFEFESAMDFQPSLPKDVDKGLKAGVCREDIGRCGVRLPWKDAEKTVQKSLQLAQDSGDKPSVVVGTGEHLFEPFLIAEALEQHGGDVVFQSTTRSPILEGEAITCKVTFQDQGASVSHYIYNLPKYRQVYVICENAENAAANGLTSKLSATDKAVHV